MILYYAVTSYHVLCCILHKMKWNPEKEAVLYISDTHPEMEKLTKAVASGNVFSQVKNFPDKGRMIPFKKKYAEKPNKNQLENLMAELCRQMEKELPFYPKDIEEYNVCGDQYALGLWLISQEKEYNYFEEGCGVYTRSYLLLENLKRLNPFQHDAALSYDCMGKNKKIIRKFVEFSSQEEGFDEKNCVDFSVKKIIKDLSKEELKQILDIFQVTDKASGEEKANLLLTQQFVNMGFLTIKEEKELYDLMLDFFALEGRLYVKPHPSDWQGLYKKWYKDATVFERFMPSELLPYVVDGKFAKGVTVSSTSIFGLESYMEEVVCLDSSFEDAYHEFYKYYVLGELTKMLDDVAITYQGKFPRLYKAMCEEKVGGKKSVYITDQLEKPKGKLTIYLNPQNKDFLPKEWMEDDKKVIPIPVEIIDTLHGETIIEYLFAWCEDEELRKCIQDLEVEKVLEKSKKQIVVDKEYYKRKCLALEGMLRVTNQRVKALLKEKEVNSNK